MGRITPRTLVRQNSLQGLVFPFELQFLEWDEVMRALVEFNCRVCSGSYLERVESREWYTCFCVDIDVIGA